MAPASRVDSEDAEANSGPQQDTPPTLDVMYACVRPGCIRSPPTVRTCPRSPITGDRPGAGTRNPPAGPMGPEPAEDTWLSCPRQRASAPQRLSSDIGARGRPLQSVTEPRLQDTCNRSPHLGHLIQINTLATSTPKCRTAFPGLWSFMHFLHGLSQVLLSTTPPRCARVLVIGSRSLCFGSGALDR